MADHDAIIAFARAHSLTTVIDGTLLSPALFRPCERGYDLVVHSGMLTFVIVFTNHLSNFSKLTC